MATPRSRSRSPVPRGGGEIEDVGALRDTIEYYRGAVDSFRRSIGKYKQIIENQERTIKVLEDCVKALVVAKASYVEFIDEKLQENQETISQLEQENAKLHQRIQELEQRPQLPKCGLPDLTRAALDQVRKWDADNRVEDQTKTIMNLRRDLKHEIKENARLEEEVQRCRLGKDLTMRNFWYQFSTYYLTEELPAEQVLPDYNPDENIYAFMLRLIEEIDDEQSRRVGTFGFSMLLPKVDGSISAEDAP
jgi:predicted RNase H-like nuclease (RuvC/YqgF family)